MCSFTVPLAPIPAQGSAELVEGARVENVRRLKPGPPRHHHAPAQAPERVAGMTVTGDDEPRAAIARELRMDVVGVEPLDLAVDLDRDAVPRRGVDDRVHVDRVGLALQEAPPGGMAEDVDVRVL